MKPHAILLVCATSLGCSLKPPNTEVCIELLSGNAFCRYTLQDTERYLNKAEWDAISAGRFSMTAEGFGDYQKFIEEVCVRYKCTEQEKKAQKKLIESMKEFKNGF